jgi:hypothetical protein
LIRLALFILARRFVRPFVAASLLSFFVAGPAISANEGKMPRPDHVVIVIEENKSYAQIIASSILVNTPARYINELARAGALFTNSFALTHPSQPNYLALFSGSTHGVTDDSCPLSLSGNNLAGEFRKHGYTFAIFSESMPAVGFDGCFSPGNLYARKHNPLANWHDLPANLNVPFSAFPSDYSKLPTVSIVVPNQLNDMHDGATQSEAIAQGDRWLKDNLDSYTKWARSNNSLLILTWDEDDGSSDNQIATIFIGPMVKPGRYGKRVDHFNVLRTILAMYGLAPLGGSANAKPIAEAWR